MRISELYAGVNESRPDSPHSGHIGLCNDTLVLLTASFYHAAPDIAQYIVTTIVKGSISRVDTVSEQIFFGPCGRVQTVEEFMSSAPRVLNATCGAGMHAVIQTNFRTSNGSVYHFRWNEASQRDLEVWFGPDPTYVEHLLVRGDWAQVVCKDIDADGLEDILVLSTTDGYLAPDLHIQLFNLRMSSEE